MATLPGGVRMSLRDMFPHLTEPQVQALHAGKPLPPSPDWVPEAGATLIPELRAVRMDPPLVTAVMVLLPGEHGSVALRAVDDFVQQTYPSRQLVVVNANPKPLFRRALHPVSEIMAEASSSLGGLRSLGVKAAAGEWLMQWDYDAAHHPERMAFQMLHRRDGMAVALDSQLRADVTGMLGRDVPADLPVEDAVTAYVHHAPAGIPSTLLFPAALATPHPESGLADFEDFWARRWAFHTVVARCPGFPHDCYHTQVYHTRSRNRPDEDGLLPQGINLAGDQLDYLRTVLLKHGLRIEYSAPTAPVQDDVPAV